MGQGARLGVRTCRAAKYPSPSRIGKQLISVNRSYYPQVNRVEARPLHKRAAPAEEAAHGKGRDADDPGDSFRRSGFRQCLRRDGQAEAVQKILQFAGSEGAQEPWRKLRGIKPIQQHRDDGRIPSAVLGLGIRDGGKDVMPCLFGIKRCSCARVPTQGNRKDFRPRISRMITDKDHEVRLNFEILGQFMKQHHNEFRNIFPSLCVLCVFVVKTADLKLNIGFRV